MAKGILRVLDGTPLSPELLKTLSELLPDFELETYQKTPDYRQSYAKRIESLSNAFSFLLEAYPIDSRFTPLTAETLKNYVAECKAACNLKENSVDDLQKELNAFTAKVVDVIANNWNWGDGKKGAKAAKEAIACLNEAECYQMMMSHGRTDLATLTCVATEKGRQYVLQVDRSLPPHYDLLVAELEQLKKLNYPKTPSWFKALPDYQQAYFCNLKLDNISSISVLQDFNKFMESWEGIKKSSLSFGSELNQIQSNSTPLPAWYNELSLHHKEMVKTLAVNPSTISTKLDKLKQMLIEQSSKDEFKNNLSAVASIPQWYWVLPSLNQHLLEHVLKNAETVQDAVAFVSSRLRDLPLPSNLAYHRLYSISEKKTNGPCEVTPHFDARYRSSHVATRDALDEPDAVQSRHVDSNLAKVMEKAKLGQVCLMQTLISPIHAKDYVPSAVTDWLPDFPPDLELYKLGRAAAARSEKSKIILQHNHPYNHAKRWYYTQADDPDSLELLKNAQKYVSEVPGLQELLDDYKSVLESPLGSATFWDYDGRELFLSSLEQLIVLTIGGYSYGSCVSGKDRKALELIHTDAMILYKHYYGAWPKFGDPKEKEERICFVNLFVSLYVSRHQHEHAGQNAPGSEGIKTPDMYLPKDTGAAINRYLGTDKGLEFDDRQATNNEVKNIDKKLKDHLLPQDELLCRLMAKQLGEDTCTKLYDALRTLVYQDSLFLSKAKDWGIWSKKEATGIVEIRKLMGSGSSGKNNVERLGAIFTIANKRPDNDSTRTDATNSVYDHLRDMLKPTKPGENVQSCAAAATKEWTALFDKSKEFNRTVPVTGVV